MTISTNGRQSTSERLRSAIEAALILAIGMGIGRFSYTAILPHMVAEGVLTMQGGSLAASANYAGYLLGAVISVRAHAHNAHRLCMLSVIGTAACLALLAILSSTWLIIVVRGLAGIFSALSVIAASLWLLEQRGHFRGAPLLYAGVGAGIALSAELLVLGTHIGLHIRGMWLLLAVVTLVVGLASAPGVFGNTYRMDLTATTSSSSDDSSIAVKPLVLLYGLAGLGYIVTATYLPLLVKSALPNLDSAHVWAVFGVGAIPSCFLWHRVYERQGPRTALLLNLLVQAVGVALPIFTQSTAGYLLSAFLVGGTFMGTVTIAMPTAQSVARKTGKNLLATMTLMYGIGQIVGPVLAEALRTYSHSFSSSLSAATIALVIAALMTMRL